MMTDYTSRKLTWKDYLVVASFAIRFILWGW